MLNKTKLYLSAGAQEVWIYWEDDRVEFYNMAGQIEKSSYDISVKLPKL